MDFLILTDIQQLTIALNYIFKTCQMCYTSSIFFLSTLQLFECITQAKVPNNFKELKDMSHVAYLPHYSFKLNQVEILLQIPMCYSTMEMTQWSTSILKKSPVRCRTTLP